MPGREFRRELAVLELNGASFAEDLNFLSGERREFNGEGFGIVRTAGGQQPVIAGSGIVLGQQAQILVGALRLNGRGILDDGLVADDTQFLRQRRNPHGEVGELKFVAVVLKNTACTHGQGVDVLIGMDIISLGDFAVSNYDSKLVFTFRVPSIKTTNYVAEVQAENTRARIQSHGKGTTRKRHK